MKIAFIGTRGMVSNYGGIEVSLNEIANLLAGKGHKVTIYCRSGNYKAAITHLKNIRLVRIPTITSKHLGTFIHTFFSTLHILFSDADIVHFHALGPSVWSFLPRLFGKKTLVSVHGLDWKRKKWKLPARLFLKLCENSAVYFPHKTIVVSKNLKKYFEGKFKRQVYYLPNGVKSPLPSGDIKIKTTKDGYIFFVGRLIPEKGIHYLIKAFNEIDTDSQLLIAGRPSFTDKYTLYLQRISGPRISFLGLVEAERLKDLYEKAHIFVLPSEIEGSPLSLLEAMSHATCVLVSDIPECLEIIGDCGVSFRTGNYLDLKEKLRYLMDNPELANKIGLRAQKRVLTQYAWGPIIDELERLYLSLNSSI